MDESRQSSTNASSQASSVASGMASRQGGAEADPAKLERAELVKEIEGLQVKVRLLEEQRNRDADAHLSDLERLGLLMRGAM